MQRHLEQFYGKPPGAYSWFINSVWTLIGARRTLTKAGIRASLLNDLSVCLMALGRLEEAREALHEEAQLRGSITCFENLAFLEVASGNLQAAIAAASKAVNLAEQNGVEEDFWSALFVFGVACEHAGEAARLVEIKGRFRHLIERKIDFNAYGKWTTLTRPDRAAWRRILGSSADFREGIQALNEFKKTFQSVPIPDSPGPGDRMKDHAEKQLFRGRIGFYEHLLTAMTTTDPPAGVLEDVERAIKGFRDANSLIDLPKGLLTRAWLRFLEGKQTSIERARSDLNEAWEIAERGPMRLHLADIHLYRARLFHSVKPYPWKSPQEDLAAARKLIEQCGYWRRKEELEDAEEAAKNW
jgi:tetratricopeptide (TPR) repeat protein